MWLVYILLSQKDKKTYTGSTDDLIRRFNEHCTGKVRSTKNRLPLKVIYTESFDEESEARKKERYYKSCAGRKKLKEILRGKI